MAGGKVKTTSCNAPPVGIVAFYDYVKKYGKKTVIDIFDGIGKFCKKFDELEGIIEYLEKKSDFRCRFQEENV
ncbi:MAG: hypothetical protein ACOY4H_08810 [Thermodesulfobacteriota bacterium]